MVTMGGYQRGKRSGKVAELPDFVVLKRDVWWAYRPSTVGGLRPRQTLHSVFLLALLMTEGRAGGTLVRSPRAFATLAQSPGSAPAFIIEHIACSEKRTAR